MTKLSSLGMKLAVPFNHDPALLHGLARHREDIAELYLPAPCDVVGTMRVWYGPEPQAYRRQLPSIARNAADLGIDVNMVMNTAYLPLSEHRRVALYAAEAMKAGIRTFTLGDLHLAQAVRQACPDARIAVSMVADLHSVTRARHWMREVRPEVLILPTILNKAPARLGVFSKTGAELEVIANEGCLPCCPFFMQHACALGGWETAHESAAERYTEQCWPRKGARLWEHYQTEVLPAHAHRLKGLVSRLKLVGRGRPTEFILREIERYTALSSDRHEVFGYVEPDRVWKRVTACDRYCEACGWCERVFRRVNPGLRGPRSRWIGRSATERSPNAPAPKSRTYSAGTPRHRRS